MHVAEAARGHVNGACAWPPLSGGCHKPQDETASARHQKPNGGSSAEGVGSPRPSRWSRGTHVHQEKPFYRGERARLKANWWCRERSVLRIGRSTREEEEAIDRGIILFRLNGEEKHWRSHPCQPGRAPATGCCRGGYPRAEWMEDVRTESLLSEKMTMLVKKRTTKTAKKTEKRKKWQSSRENWLITRHALDLGLLLGLLGEEDGLIVG